MSWMLMRFVFMIPTIALFGAFVWGYNKINHVKA